jgi:hypothetical protein
MMQFICIHFRKASEIAHLFENRSSKLNHKWKTQQVNKFGLIPLTSNIVPSSIVFAMWSKKSTNTKKYLIIISKGNELIYHRHFHFTGWNIYQQSSMINSHFINIYQIQYLKVIRNFNILIEKIIRLF